MEEPGFTDPALLLDEDAMHHGDLPGRAAEAERRDACPDPRRLVEGHAVIGCCAPNRLGIG
jgi:hypothetical protein